MSDTRAKLGLCLVSLACGFMFTFCLSCALATFFNDFECQPRPHPRICVQDRTARWAWLWFITCPTVEGFVWEVVIAGTNLEVTLTLCALSGLSALKAS